MLSKPLQGELKCLLNAGVVCRHMEFLFGHLPLGLKILPILMGVVRSSLSPGWTSPFFSQKMALNYGHLGKDDTVRTSWGVYLLDSRASWGCVHSLQAPGLLCCPAELTASSCGHLIIAPMQLSWTQFRGEQESNEGRWGPGAEVAGLKQSARQC